ncbi:hypothetical protein [Opitutus terrae]|uniref:Uncharacterized protein n=1 Tax=Opitutus terrae (strain DSM 11246 / JCM 15787 / PB90-1) TaxID=452637 RepID=B2A065_OPITP|nr:hypothetical protein [Opitutus terrae]ACB77401.1 hypothetical protein Oter_4127 [Opitutus terrae PB90-1]
MKSIFLFQDAPNNDPLSATFRNYINLAYSVAVADDVPSSSLDDTEVLPGYRASLAEACHLAKREVDADPLNKGKMFYHVFLVESELIDVFGAAPAACQLVSLAVRGYMFDFAVGFRTFYGMPIEHDTRN